MWVITPFIKHGQIIGLALAVPLMLAGCGDRNKEQTRAPEAKVSASPSPGGDLDEAPERSSDGAALVIASNILDACNISRRETYFAYDSAEVRDGAKDMLEQVAVCFVDGPMRAQELAITGHADPRGSDAYNEILGRERAESVAEFLARQGLDDERIEVHSKGESQASDEPEQWAYDRKVVLALR